MKTLTITNLEALNIVAWYNQLIPEKTNVIPMKVRFHLKKAVEKINKYGVFFTNFRNDEVKKLQDTYFDDEHSIEAYETIRDADGNPELDESGAEKTEPVRKVKPEYMVEYQKEVNALNESLNSLLAEKNTLTYEGADIEGFVNNLPDDGGALDWDDINMLDAILSEDGEA